MLQNVSQKDHRKETSLWVLFMDFLYILHIDTHGIGPSDGKRIFATYYFVSSHGAKLQPYT
jgi:hypothetical protein